MKLIRRALVGVLLLLTTLCVGFTTAADSTRSSDFDFEPWPTHIEWSVYTVPGDGYLIVSPDVADSTGGHQAMQLPSGTEIYIPHRVPGEEPGARQQRKWHEA